LFLKETAKIQKKERGFAWLQAFLKKLSFIVFGENYVPYLLQVAIDEHT
jgi:hypothetical protein